MVYESNINEKRAPSLWTWVAAMCALFSAMSDGTVLGWSSSALPSMSDEDSHPHLISPDDQSTLSLIGSTMNVGALIGGLLAGPIIGFIGMKKCLIALGVPFVLGWACILSSKVVYLIIFGRVLTGFGAGLASGVAPTYVNQISTPGIRGMLGTGFQIFVNIGILYVNLFGIGVSWRWLCIPALIPAIFMSVGMLFMPESPIWLMNKYGRSRQVEDALRRLRSADSDIETELQEMEDRIEEQRKNASGFSLGQLKRADVYKPVIIANALMFFQQMSGINAVLFYAADIFKSAGSKIDPNVNAVIVTATMVVAAILGSFIMDRLGRKMLLIISGIGHTISLTLIGYYFFNANKECPCAPLVCPGPSNSTIVTTILSSTITTVGSTVETTLGTTAAPLPDCTATLAMLPVISLVIFVFLFNIGFGPIPWMMAPEITPKFALSFNSSIATGTNWLFAFIVTMTFKQIQDPSALNKHGAFWMFAGVCAASVVFTIIFVPESKGKTQEDMARIFLGNRPGTITSGNIQGDDKADGNKPVSTLY